jgi:hypothetical protein
VVGGSNPLTPTKRLTITRQAFLSSRFCKGKLWLLSLKKSLLRRTRCPFFLHGSRSGSTSFDVRARAVNAWQQNYTSFAATSRSNMRVCFDDRTFQVYQAAVKVQ